MHQWNICVRLYVDFGKCSTLKVAAGLVAALVEF